MLLRSFSPQVSPPKILSLGHSNETEPGVLDPSIRGSVLRLNGSVVAGAPDAVASTPAPRDLISQYFYYPSTPPERRRWWWFHRLRDRLRSYNLTRTEAPKIRVIPDPAVRLILWERWVNETFVLGSREYVYAIWYGVETLEGKRYGHPTENPETDPRRGP